MKKSIKSLSFSILLSLVFFTSCLEDNTGIRTYNDEMVELNELIKTLIADGNNVDTTSLGAYYIIHETGEGDFAKIGDTVSINYEGYLSDGSMFDDSDGWAADGVWEFVYGEQSLISGFNEALSLMNTNMEAEFIIPSDLAYGAYGYGYIGSYQTLIFGIKMIEIKPVSNNQ
jgi:FKBP-type peptidyl-prolyl cis-trans isomerase